MQDLQVDERAAELRETVLQAMRDIAADPHWDASRCGSADATTAAPLASLPHPSASMCTQHSSYSSRRTTPFCRACVILSGGLDSSIAACLGKEILGLTAAFTVLCSPAASDRPYAAEVAVAAGLRHHVIEATLEEVLEELPECVRVLQSFDPMTLRNDIAGKQPAVWGGGIVE